METFKTICIVLLFSLLNLVYCWPLNERGINKEAAPSNDWDGKWFPAQPPGGHHHGNIAEGNVLYDSLHKVKMGIPSNCDNAMVNLTMDWDYSSADFICYDNKRKYEPQLEVFPVMKCDHIPPGYSAMHGCMDEKIEYAEKIPTFGTHRPLWPRYGEYNYVPVQRWLHNLEHGAVVLLYHPCVNQQELKNIKNIVKSCLYRHIITPFQYLDPERPLALVTWGCKIEFSKVDSEMVVQFIRDKALRGPEAVSRDGQFSQQLIDPARIVTTQNDKTLCPNF